MSNIGSHSSSAKCIQRGQSKFSGLSESFLSSSDSMSNHQSLFHRKSVFNIQAYKVRVSGVPSLQLARGWCKKPRILSSSDFHLQWQPTQPERCMLPRLGPAIFHGLRCDRYTQFCGTVRQILLTVGSFLVLQTSAHLLPVQHPIGRGSNPFSGAMRVTA